MLKISTTANFHSDNYQLDTNKEQTVQLKQTSPQVYKPAREGFCPDKKLFAKMVKFIETNTKNGRDN